MTDYTNAYFTGYGVETQDPGPTYYSNYIEIRDIMTNSLIASFNTLKGLQKFDVLGGCAVKLTVMSINYPGSTWKNDCAIYCATGKTQPQSTWQI